MSVHGVGFRACAGDGLAPEPRPAAPIEIRATWKGGGEPVLVTGFVFLSHGHRGPRWVRDHVGSRLRPAPAATDVAEPSGTGPPTRSVRLEPQPDPGDQTLKEEDP
ncbi:hypothetical protein [Streptomyces vinaceus]|uniref:hypothetical protein n=1 Tax=Streptomyces vinaceus TaxID=1960 RepID=UPI0036ADF647